MENTQEVSMDQASVQAPANASNPLTQKYPALSAVFLRGNFQGQLNSAYRDREKNKEKAVQYIQALANGDAAMPEDGKVTRKQAMKLRELGMEVDEANIKQGKARAGKKGNPDYPALGATFLRGKFKGQVGSAYKDRMVNQAKAADYIKALKAGVCPGPIDNKVTAKEADMLVALGHSDHGYEIQGQRSVRRSAKKSAQVVEVQATEVNAATVEATETAQPVEHIVTLEGENTQP